MEIYHEEDGSEISSILYKKMIISIYKKEMFFFFEIEYNFLPAVMLCIKYLPKPILNHYFKMEKPEEEYKLVKEREMLLIIDNQSTFIKKFKRDFLSEQDFKYMFFDHNEPLKLPEGAQIMGIILSGGKGTPYEPLNLTTNFVAMMNYDVPVLGLCLGHEIIAAANMGRVRKLPEPQRKRERITIIEPDDPIFQGLDKPYVSFTERHTHHVSDLPENFIRLGESEVCPNEIIKHRDKPIYGFQSHPEVSGEDGLQIMRNFLRICGFNI